MQNKSIKSLVIVYSYHHKNTEKIANSIANVLEAEVKYPDDVNLDEIKNYALVGLGAGIDSGKHYAPILKLANELPIVKAKKAFIFSTSAIIGKKKMKKDHSALRKILNSKGYEIVDEFHCKGFNTNSFLKYFGGMNKKRPNAQDLENAQIFARKIKQYTV